MQHVWCILVMWWAWTKTWSHPFDKTANLRFWPNSRPLSLPPHPHGVLVWKEAISQVAWEEAEPSLVMMFERLGRSHLYHGAMGLSQKIRCCFLWTLKNFLGNAFIFIGNQQICLTHPNPTSLGSLEETEHLGEHLCTTEDEKKHLILQS